MANLETLRRCRLFDLLSEEELAKVAPLFQTHYFRKGDFVCREGAWGDSMFVVDSGEIRISKKLDVNNNWDITTMGPGEFFGEVSLLDGSPRTAAAMTTTNSTVLELYGRDFKSLLSRGDAVAVKLLEGLLRVLINRIRATDDVVAKIMVESLNLPHRAQGDLRDKFRKMMV